MSKLAWSIAALALPIALTACASDDEVPMAIDVSHGQEEGPAGPAGGDDDDDAGAGAGSKRADDPNNWVAPGYRPLDEWKDETRGEVATVVYITETRVRGKLRPAAMVFSSDPSNAHFNRPRDTKQVTIRRLYRNEMRGLLRELRAIGFERLPWQDVANYDADIGPERALHLYREKKRWRVIKGPLDLREKMAFRKVEDRLIRISMTR